MTDPWQSGSAYDRYMGRWSRLTARQFLGWLNVPPGRTWLDVGCGTGTLSGLILECCAPSRVDGIDTSPAFIAYAQQAIASPLAGFRVGNAQALEFDSAAFDATVSGLVLNFVPQPAAALAEMLRVTRPGGTLGAFVWDYAHGMQMLRYFWDAAVDLDPAARKFDEGEEFPLCREGALAALAREARLAEVTAQAIVVETVYRDFDDYWQPFLGGVGPGSVYALSLEPARRERLAARLRETLPIASNGSIHLSARAWAVKGIKALP